MSSLSTQQARLQDDLRGLVSGEVRCDEVMLQLYATDASPFECRPMGVVWPRSTRDVVVTVEYCAERGIPVHPRGSGTTTAGGSLGPGILLDFTRYMRRIVQADESTVLVQPGAVRERFNDILKRSQNRFFAPNAGFLPTSTIGSILSTDVAGPRWLKYGFPHEAVREMEVVTATGRVFHLSPVDLASPPADVPAWWNEEPFGPLRELLAESAETIAAEEPFGMPVRTGYGLRGVWDGRFFNPARLFSGAEGSLGIITAVRLATSVRPEQVGAAVLLFDSLENAVRSVEPLLDFSPTLCELIDRRTINMLRQRDHRFARFLSPQAETALLVELDGETLEDVSDRLTRLIREIRYRNRLAFGSWPAIEPRQRELFNDLLKRSEFALFGIEGGFRVVPLLDDNQVPVPALAKFIPTLQNILKRHQLTYTLGGHLGQGQVRVLAVVESEKSDTDESILSAANEIADAAFSFGGSISSASPTGLARIRGASRRFPRLEPVYQKIKRLFDPSGLMNPGRGVFLPEDVRYFPAVETTNAPWIGSFRKRPVPASDTPTLSSSENSQSSDGVRNVGEESAERGEFPELESTVFGTRNREYLRKVRLGRLLKTPPASEPKGTIDRTRRQLEVQLRWDERQVGDDVFRCTGCGLCRSRTPDLRICPAFRHYPDEQASCRAKANILRGVLDHSLELETLTGEDLRAIADDCIHCHVCQSECPAGADIPKLAFRIKSAQNAAHGMSLSDKFLSNTDVFLRFSSIFSCLSNRLLTGRLSRWTAEKLFGIPQGRKFPKIERFSALSRLAWSKRPSRLTHRVGRKVVLFIDTFTNYFDIRLAEAAVKVLEHNGIDVYIPTRQRGSGHQAFALGNPDRAERLSQQNIRLLADLIRQGYEVVTIEPLSAVSLSREYLWLREDPEALLVARHTTDICQYLYRLHEEGRLLYDFSPIPVTVGYHAPCRTLALTGARSSLPTPAEELLRLIPRLLVERLERGCCGLAGPQGFKKENYPMSLRLGMPLFLALREPGIAFGSTECSFCRLQMEQGTQKSVIHPIKLLAAAYGLGPDPAAGKGR